MLYVVPRFFRLMFDVDVVLTYNPVAFSLYLSLQPMASTASLGQMIEQCDCGIPLELIQPIVHLLPNLRVAVQVLVARLYPLKNIMDDHHHKNFHRHFLCKLIQMGICIQSTV